MYLLLCIQYYSPDEGQKTCPKHVQSYLKNKFEKLVHLVGFIVRIRDLGVVAEIRAQPWPNKRTKLNFFSQQYPLHLLLCYKCKHTMQGCVDDDKNNIYLFS